MWAVPNRTQTWRLDETEGPQRIRYVDLGPPLYARYVLTALLHRKKMEPNLERLSDSRVDGVGRTRDVDDPDSDMQSIVQVELPPWAEAYEISAMEVDGQWSFSFVCRCATHGDRV